MNSIGFSYMIWRRLAKPDEVPDDEEKQMQTAVNAVPAPALAPATTSSSPSSSTKHLLANNATDSASSFAAPTGGFLNYNTIKRALFVSTSEPVIGGSADAKKYDGHQSQSALSSVAVVDDGDSQPPMSLSAADADLMPISKRRSSSLATIGSVVSPITTKGAATTSVSKNGSGGASLC